MLRCLFNLSGWANRCNIVRYHNRNICALKGSSVDINCIYGTNWNWNIETKFWFRAETNPSPPRNLQLDNHYQDRVEYPSAPYGQSTLRIKNVTESDSAEYRFKFITSNFEWKSTLPGTTLTITAVQMQVVDVQVEDSHVSAWLSCHTSCRPAAVLSFCLMKNGVQFDCTETQRTKQLRMRLNPGDYVTCAVQGYPLSVSSRLYALKAPRVQLSDRGEILEGHSLTLTCRTDIQTSYRQHWYKKIRPSGQQALGTRPELVFTPIQSSDSAEYFCVVENDLGKRTSQSVMIDVKYAPKCSVLRLSPPQDIQEGQSMVLGM
ncbi:protein turtle-like [Syngnathoides biaculeatus]|uniref:protein turtle-like n=1 Tax=Syngnathoides biaculeatus TaxID=300417 RepID=UPI002ADD6AA0|nr:protein turtle-like [Syngnathoides biaculeatus]